MGTTFVPTRVGNVWRHFRLSQVGGKGVTWHRAEASITAKHPTMPRAALTTMNNSAQNISSARVKKPSFG